MGTDVGGGRLVGKMCESLIATKFTVFLVKQEAKIHWLKMKKGKKELGI